MTKLVSLMMIGAFAIGCGGKQPAESTTTSKTNTTDSTDTTTEGVPCEQEVALECPEGQIDACLKQPAEGDTHRCVDE